MLRLRRFLPIAPPKKPLIPKENDDNFVRMDDKEIKELKL